MIRTDVDEILIADPVIYGGLGDFVAAERRPYATAVGLDVVQMTDEPPLDFGVAPLLGQRKFARPPPPTAKPAIVRRPVLTGWGSTLARRRRCLATSTSST